MDRTRQGDGIPPAGDAGEGAQGLGIAGAGGEGEAGLPGGGAFARGHGFDMFEDPDGEAGGGVGDAVPRGGALRVGIDDLSARHIDDPERDGVAVEIGDGADDDMGGGEEPAYPDGAGVVLAGARDEVVFLENELDLVAFQELDFF